MIEQELIERTRTLIQRFDNMRIVGQGWAGNAREGFQFDALSAGLFVAGAGDGGGPPTPSTGACCKDGTCSILTPGGCAVMGGTYQGNGTDCDPNPCAPSPTGACCKDRNCSIQTEGGCVADGGTYLGDATTCDGHPCCLPSACTTHDYGSTHCYCDFPLPEDPGASYSRTLDYSYTIVRGYFWIEGTGCVSGIISDTCDYCTLTRNFLDGGSDTCDCCGPCTSGQCGDLTGCISCDCELEGEPGNESCSTSLGPTDPPYNATCDVSYYVIDSGDCD